MGIPKRCCRNCTRLHGNRTTGFWCGLDESKADIEDIKKDTGCPDIVIPERSD